MKVNECSHFPGEIVKERTDHCEGGDEAVCLSCGHVGCCDSSSGQHARKHAEETGHKVMASYPVDFKEDGKVGEGSWMWCYEENNGEGEYLEY